MHNIAIIGIILVALGGIWFLSTNNSETMSDTDTAVTSETAQMEDTAMNDTMSNDTMAATEADMEAEADAPDIVEAAMSTESLATLVTAVSEAELVATLQSEGPFTVFAPTNAAFEALPAGTLETLLMAENQADLQGILTYHVVPGEVTAADLTDGMTLETVSGETITIGVGDAGVTINGEATVTTADVMTSNGVVHIIDTVLLPESS